MLVSGDFNTPLTLAPPHIYTPDTKFDKASHSDKFVFQELIVEFKLVAIHCKQTLRFIFLHGSHASRIDCMFIREHQIRWKQLNAHVRCKFECIHDVIIPIRRSLSISLPRSFAAPNTKILSISHRSHSNLIGISWPNPRWHEFHTTRGPSFPLTKLGMKPKHDPMIVQSRVFELEFSQLCIDFFPRGKRRCTQLHRLGSITSQMRTTRRVMKQCTQPSLLHCFR